ncbi:MAG: site-2 protease family protein [Chloroflexi bacterium]|nr:site-2 protease family protein [Chloroflexota bacterium]
MFGKGFPLGTMFGFKVRADWSWIFIAVLIIWFLAAQVFNNSALWDTMPPVWLLWVMAIITMLIFCATVMVHELAHAYFAKKAGIPVKNISMTFVGASAQMIREPDNPIDEFKISISGPLFSAAIGVVFYFSAQLLAEAGLALEICYILRWVGFINLIMAALNLVPAFPLDGGRALRSIIWVATKDFKKASKAASAVGRVLSVGIIICGLIWGFSTQNWLGGFMLAIIGFITYTSATNSTGQYAMQRALSIYTVSQALKMMHQINQNAQLSDVARNMIQGGINTYLVSNDQEEIVAVLEADDVKKLPLAKIQEVKVKDCAKSMRQDLAVYLQTNLLAVVQSMNFNDVTVVPVENEQGQIINVLHMDDIIIYLNSVKHTIEQN